MALEPVIREFESYAEAASAPDDLSNAMPKPLNNRWKTKPIECGKRLESPPFSGLVRAALAAPQPEQTHD